MIATPPRIVIFGAGAVGRGFIGELFSEAGWVVSFLDVDQRIVETLRTDGYYQHRTVGDGEVVKQVGPVVAGYSTDPVYVAREIAAARLIATSVGAASLPGVASVLRDSLLARLDAGGAAVNVLLCENLHRAPEVMRALLHNGLDPDDVARLDAGVGLVETSVGRMIPLSDPTGAVTSVAAEPYRVLPVDAAALKGPPIDVPGIVADADVDFGFYADQKLYIHNLGHYVCGLLAQHRGYELVWEGVADPDIHHLTRAAMVESAVALSARYHRPITPLIDHVDDLLHRFANRSLADTVSRVVRDPHRKLAPDDRMLGALAAAVAAGTPTRHLSMAVAVAAVHLETVENWTPTETLRHLRAAVDQTPTPWGDSHWSTLESQLGTLREHGIDAALQA